MKILVINGSPKGKYSITLQHTNYLQILHPEHEFDILHAGQSIKALEKDFSSAIDALADKLTYALEHNYLPPQNFYGIGGMKVFRDLIWIMQGMMRADHKFYKSHGQYDFPQKQWPRMVAMYAVGAMLANPKLKSKMGNKMNEGMLMPYQKALKEAQQKVKEAAK